MLNLVDTHCHLNSEEMEKDLENILQRANDQNITRIMIVGADIDSSIKAVNLSKHFTSSGLYAAVGVHPHDSSSIPGGIPEVLVSLSHESCVRAIGETGLDYHYDLSPRSQQRDSLAWHIDLAKRVGKPLIVHIRESFDDAIDILTTEKAEDCGGIIHCFSGSWDDAVKVLDLGFYISFAGPVTYPKNKDLQEIASRVPMEKLLCETDSPYLAPQFKRGKVNEPSFVVYIFQFIAQLRNMDLENFVDTVWNNSCRVFKWGGE